MATARRAYTSEYSFNFVPEVQPERVRRTRQRPEVNTKEQPKQGQGLTPAALRTLIVAVVAIGIMLMGIVVVNAQAAKLQYSINQLRNQNSIMETEITMLSLELDTARGISQLETYASDKLKMHYPQGSECVHLSAVESPGKSLANTIRQKAYE